jgi:hypothetical protein
MLLLHLDKTASTSILLIGVPLLQSLFLSFIELFQLSQLLFTLAVHFLKSILEISLFLTKFLFCGLKLFGMARAYLLKSFLVVLLELFGYGAELVTFRFGLL